MCRRWERHLPFLVEVAAGITEASVLQLLTGCLRGVLWLRRRVRQ